MIEAQNERGEVAGCVQHNRNASPGHTHSPQQYISIHHCLCFPNKTMQCKCKCNFSILTTKTLTFHFFLALFHRNFDRYSLPPLPCISLTQPAQLRFPNRLPTKYFTLIASQLASSTTPYTGLPTTIGLFSSAHGSVWFNFSPKQICFFDQKKKLCFYLVRFWEFLLQKRYFNDVFHSSTKKKRCFPKLSS